LVLAVLLWGLLWPVTAGAHAGTHEGAQQQLPPGGKPHGIDLDVLYIERTPKYASYAVDYRAGIPHLAEGTETAGRWPQPGELVTFSAHVTNKGTDRSSSFQVTWYIDDAVVQEEMGPPLWPDEEVVFTYRWPWAHRLDGERLLDAHRVRVELDTANQIAETFEGNNSLEDRTDALGLVLSVAPEVYRALEYTPQAGRTYSAEDWLQRHVQALNASLAAAVTPATPNGVSVRVRIDKIRITWGPPGIDRSYDGGWFVAADYRRTSDHYDPAADIDWGMLHEWGHQLGLIDTYRYGVHAESVDIERSDGRPWADSYDFPGAGLMEHARDGILGEYSAAALERTAGYRRGYYGEYQYDLPAALTLSLRDRRDCPFPGATITFYQRDPYRTPDAAAPRIDNVPEFSGVTDAAGHFLLPNHPLAQASGATAPAAIAPGATAPSATDPVPTATGHTLRPNPFGVIDLVGSGNIGVLKLEKAGRTQYTWLALPDLNLAFWRAGSPAAQTFTVFWDGEADGDNGDDSTGCGVAGTIGAPQTAVYLPLVER
jgi:hypothetical protein